MSRSRTVNQEVEYDYRGCFLQSCKTTTKRTSTTTTTTTTTRRTTTDAKPDNAVTNLWPGSTEGDVVFIGGKNKQSIIKELTVYNLVNRAERTIISSSRWRSYGGPGIDLTRLTVLFIAPESNSVFSVRPSC